MKAPSQILKCKYCGKEVKVPANRLLTFKYCSRSCSALASRIQITRECEVCKKPFTHISSRSNKAKYCSRQCYYKSQSTKGTVTVTCRHCGKEFKTSPSDAKHRLYCSKSCVNKESKKTFKPSFTTVRKAMQARGLINKCNRCGFNTVPDILGVHHKDRDHTNNDLSNLEVLCPNCHSIEHNKHICQHK